MAKTLKLVALAPRADGHLDRKRIGCQGPVWGDQPASITCQPPRPPHRYYSGGHADANRQRYAQLDLRPT